MVLHHLLFVLNVSVTIFRKEPGQIPIRWIHLLDHYLHAPLWRWRVAANIT